MYVNEGIFALWVLACFFKNAHFHRDSLQALDHKPPVGKQGRQNLLFDIGVHNAASASHLNQASKRKQMSKHLPRQG